VARRRQIDISDSSMPGQAQAIEDRSVILNSVSDAIGGDASSNEDIVQAVLLVSAELHSVFTFYSGLDPAHNVGASRRSPSQRSGISLTAWLKLMEDVRLDKKVAAEQVFKAACVDTDAASARLSEGRFVNALVRLALCSSPIRDDGVDIPQLLSDLKQVLHDYVLPYAHRDSSTSFKRLMVTRPEMVEFVEATRKSFSGNGVTWECWLELWHQIPLAHIPGYPDWEPQAFRSLSENFGVLLRVYSYYAKLSWLRSWGSTEQAHALSIRGTEWAQFVSDCNMSSSKFGDTQLLNRVGYGTPAAFLPQFLSSLLALAFWRCNNFAISNLHAARTATQENPLRPFAHCLSLALREHVIPLAGRDTSQRFRARVEEDPEVTKVLEKYGSQLTQHFKQLCGNSLGRLDCETALAWLEERGVLGEVSLQISAPLHASLLSGSVRAKPLVSSLSTRNAIEAFINSIPPHECLASSAELTGLRSFQEWLTRCAEIKYMELPDLSIAQRLRGLLENALNGHSTQHVMLEAAHLQVPERFDVRSFVPPTDSDPAHFALCVELWGSLNLGAIPGFPAQQRRVFNTILSHIVSLVSVFAHYCRSSLIESSEHVKCRISLIGWAHLVDDCHMITKSFSIEKADSVYASIAGNSDGLSLSGLIEALVFVSFMRSNAELLELHKRTAPRLVPIDHTLDSFLRTNVLPFARRRDLLGLRRYVQHDATLQRLVADNTESALSILQATSCDRDMNITGMRAADFVRRLVELRIVCDVQLQLTVWQHVSIPTKLHCMFGDYVTKSCACKLTLADVKQSLVDTVLTDLVHGDVVQLHSIGDGAMVLSQPGIMEALVRCAVCAFELIPALDDSRRTAALFDVLVHQLDAQEAVSRYMNTGAPTRFSTESITQARTTNAYLMREHHAWVLIWKHLDLSDLPGFPAWEEKVFHLLQSCWATMLSVFLYYSRLGDSVSAGPHGRVSMWAFLQFAMDCKATTKIFTIDRVRSIFEYSAKHQLHDDGGPLSSDRRLRALTFPTFLEAVVRFAFERANPKWARDSSGRLNAGFPVYMIPVSDCLDRFVHNCVLRFSPRDSALEYSQQLLADSAMQDLFTKRGQDVIRFLCSTVSADIPEQVELNSTFRFAIHSGTILALFSEHQLFEDESIGIDHTDTPCSNMQKYIIEGNTTLNEHFVLTSMMNVQTFARGCAGGGLDSLEGVDGLSAYEFMELAVYCGNQKYAYAEDRVTRVAAFLNVLLNGNKFWEKRRVKTDEISTPKFDAQNEPPPEDEAEWSNEDQVDWLQTWQQLNLQQIPGFKDHERAIFRALRSSRQQLLCLYSRAKGLQSAVTRDAWQHLIIDAALTTRSLDQSRAYECFDNAATTNKVGIQVLRFPNFVDALVRAAHFRIQKLLPDGKKPTPLHEGILAILSLAFARTIKDEKARPRSLRSNRSRKAGVCAPRSGNRFKAAAAEAFAGLDSMRQTGGATSTTAIVTCHGNSAGHGSDGSALSMRVDSRLKASFVSDGLLGMSKAHLYQRCLTAWSSYTKDSLASGRKIVHEFYFQRGTQKIRRMFSCWQGWLADWKLIIRESSDILQPMLPLNLQSAFEYWRYWSRCPKLMTSIAIWFMTKVGTTNLSNAEEAVLRRVDRTWWLKSAFDSWSHLHARTATAVTVVNRLQRELILNMLLRVLDAWVRLTIQERGVRFYDGRDSCSQLACASSVAMSSSPDEPKQGRGSTVETGATGVAHENSAQRGAFFSGKLDVRGTTLRPGEQAWASLARQLNVCHLPGVNEHLPAIQSLLEESLYDLCLVFRQYAKRHIQARDEIAQLTCLQLYEWLLFCEDVGLSSRRDVQMQLLLASQYENAQRRHRHSCHMSMPQFIEAVVCVSALSTSENKTDSPTRLKMVLANIKGIVKRDLSASFRQAFWSDPAVIKVLRLNDLSLRSVFVDRGWRSEGPSLSQFEAFMLELGLVCDGYWVQPLGTAGCELSLSVEQVKEAYVDSLEMFFSDATFSCRGLSYEGVLECMARCSIALYGPLNLSRLHHFLACLLRNVIHGNTIEEAATGVWLEVRDGDDMREIDEQTLCCSKSAARRKKRGSKLKRSMSANLDQLRNSRLAVDDSPSENSVSACEREIEDGLPCAAAVSAVRSNLEPLVDRGRTRATVVPVPTLKLAGAQFTDTGSKQTHS